jgi:GT2 family glycosyltransferase
MHGSGPGPEIDVVVATRDRPALLAACIAGLAAQTVGRFRLILVDDGSRVPVTDAPATAAGLDCVVVRNASPAGPGPSRNRGVEAATAAHVLFLDDDAVPQPHLVEAHRAAFAGDEGPVVSIGSLLPPPGVRLPPWDMWQADRLAREGRRIVRGESQASWRHLFSGNAAVRRADFEAVGGFDPAFARQEDVELGYRLARHGCRFVFAAGALVWHDARHELADWLRIPAASARYDAEMDRRLPEAERLRSVREEIGGRHPLLKASRRVVGDPAGGRRTERLAIAAARGLHRVRADRASMAAISLVWDIEYNRALAEVTSPDGGSRSTPP